MNDCLRELGQLFHAERISFEFAIARFAETDIKERFVRAFECGFGRKSGQLGHQANEMNAVILAMNESRSGM